MLATLSFSRASGSSAPFSGASAVRIDTSPASAPASVLSLPAPPTTITPLLGGGPASTTSETATSDASASGADVTTSAGAASGIPDSTSGPASTIALASIAPPASGSTWGFTGSNVLIRVHAIIAAVTTPARTIRSERFLPCPDVMSAFSPRVRASSARAARSIVYRSLKYPSAYHVFLRGGEDAAGGGRRHLPTVGRRVEGDLLVEKARRRVARIHAKLARIFGGSVADEAPVRESRSENESRDRVARHVTARHRTVLREGHLHLFAEADGDRPALLHGIRVMIAGLVSRSHHPVERRVRREVRHEQGGGPGGGRGEGRRRVVLGVGSLRLVDVVHDLVLRRLVVHAGRPGQVHGPGEAVDDGARDAGESRRRVVGEGLGDPLDDVCVLVPGEVAGPADEVPGRVRRQVDHLPAVGPLHAECALRVIEMSLGRRSVDVVSDEGRWRRVVLRLGPGDDGGAGAVGDGGLTAREGRRRRVGSGSCGDDRRVVVEVVRSVAGANDELIRL